MTIYQNTLYRESQIKKTIFKEFNSSPLKYILGILTNKSLLQKKKKEKEKDPTSQNTKMFLDLNNV